MINSSPGTGLPVSTEDFVALQRLVHRYADAVVHRNAAQWASCWAGDAQWDLGRGRKVTGKAAIVDLWSKAMGGFSAVVQMVHNGDASTTGDPDRAVGRWYIDERFLRADGQNGMLLAHYEDEYVRTPAGWLFASRFLEVHYQGAADLSGEFQNTPEKLAARGAGNA
jgi:hypothetical protein